MVRTQGLTEISGNCLSKERVVVTGGAGFIGSHLVEALSKQYSVLILDNFSTGTMKNLDASRSSDVKVVRGDIRDPSLIRATLRHAMAVFHEAARVSVTRSVKDPALTNDVNVNGTLNLLIASVKNRVKRFVFASSSSVYGEKHTPSKREDMVPTPISPYGVSKLSAESYCRAFYRTYGLETVSLRYFNVFGPRQRLGPYTGVITTFIKRASKKQPPVIYGDGTQTRDFTYVTDVVQANLLALESHDAAGEAFNIGTGTSTTVDDLAKSVIRLCHQPKLRIVRKPARPGDILHSRADISRARKVLGYKSHVKLEEGLQHVVNWMNR